MRVKCSPPKSVSVRDYTRSKSRRKPKPRSSSSPYAVVDTRTGRVISRHRHFDTAARRMKQLDRAAYRAGRGHPYAVRKATP